MCCQICAGVMTMHEEKLWRRCNSTTRGSHLFSLAQIVAALEIRLSRHDDKATPRVEITICEVPK